MAVIRDEERICGDELPPLQSITVIECQWQCCGRRTQAGRGSRPKLSAGSPFMQLQMKTRCERCEAVLRADGHAYICSYECTFCAACASDSQGTCPNCTGELTRRPRRTAPVQDEDTVASEGPWGMRPRLIWAASFGVWSLVALAASGSIYELWRSRGYPMTFVSVLASELSQILTYAPLTPLVLALAMRFPIQRGNWVRRSLLHLLFALAFCIAHITLRGLTPYAAWDAKLGRFVSAVWNSQTHVFAINWQIFKNLFLSNVVDDTTGTYVPIVLLGTRCRITADSGIENCIPRSLKCS